MRVFVNKHFARFKRKEGIEDETLWDAVDKAESGLIDANLGGGVLKLRIARPGEGESGGYRTIVFFRSRERAVFVYGFPKSVRGNIGPDELRAFKKSAVIVLGSDIKRAVEVGALKEIRRKRKHGGG